MPRRSRTRAGRLGFASDAVIQRRQRCRPGRRCTSRRRSSSGAPATVRADIYSAGVLLFHLLTGAYPVRGATVKEVGDGTRARQRLDLAATSSRSEPGACRRDRAGYPAESFGAVRIRPGHARRSRERAAPGRDAPEEALLAGPRNRNRFAHRRRSGSCSGPADDSLVEGNAAPAQPTSARLPRSARCGSRSYDCRAPRLRTARYLPYSELQPGTWRSTSLRPAPAGY